LLKNKGYVKKEEKNARASPDDKTGNPTSESTGNV